MKILDLNCQKAFQPGLPDFLQRALASETYDIFLLQEVNDDVYSLLSHPAYTFIQAFNTQTDQPSQTCIGHRISSTCVESGFHEFASFRNDPVRGFKHPAFGMSWADISIDAETIRFVSIHLHSGIDSHIRLVELARAKEVLLKNVQPSMPIIIAGDFNAGFPWELRNIASALAPKLHWANEHLGPTLDSRYSENAAHIPNRIGFFLAKFNIAIRLRTDHVYMDQKTAKTYTINCSILPDRVSDHSPIEITLIRKTNE